MKRYLLLATLAIAPLACAQGLKLAVFDRLRDKATDKTEIELPKALIRAAGGFLGDDADSAKAKKLVEGLESVLVKSLEFDKPGVYTNADVQQLISELATPGWSQIVNVSENGGKDVSRIWVKIVGDGEIAGLRILAAEGEELSVVEIVGKVRLQDLAGLEFLGLPPNILKGAEKSEKKKEE
jgi:hypothetical protein